jgi:GDPmannose 4,6-dehydratase
MEVRVAPGAYSRAGHAPTIPIITVDPRYFRPTEVETLLGDPTKARDKLGWMPRITFDELVAEMVREDLAIAKRDDLVRNSGYTVMSHHE